MSHLLNVTAVENTLVLICAYFFFRDAEVAGIKSHVISPRIEEASNKNENKMAAS